MSSLYKLDLEPDEIYNVSFNIKQGDKTVDTLRFFQTQVPKLFNLKPSNYTTFSKITEVPSPVIKKDTVSGGGLTGGGDVTLKAKEIVSKRTSNYEFSEGQVDYRAENLYYTFTIKFNGPPKFMGWNVSGFKGIWSFLNNRTDFQVSGNNLKVTLSLAQLDPSSVAKLKDVSSSESFTVSENIKQGQTKIYCDSLKGIIPGRTTLGTVTVGDDKGYWKSGTKVSSFVPGQKFFTVPEGALLKKLNSGQNISASNTYKVTGFTGIYEKLNQTNNSETFDGDSITSGRFVHQTIPTYNTPQTKTTYQFNQNTFISSSIINPTVIESLIWEDTVRDHVFFIIADGDSQSKKYFFGNYGQIVVATTTKALTGNILFNVKKPPAAPDVVKDLGIRQQELVTPQVQFYDSGLTAASTNATSPQLKREIIVQFAIARYVKKNNVWSGEWLGPKSGETANLANVLSSPEVLE
jgi:hypothetical protein